MIYSTFFYLLKFLKIKTGENQISGLWSNLKWNYQWATNKHQATIDNLNWYMWRKVKLEIKSKWKSIRVFFQWWFSKRRRKKSWSLLIRLRFDKNWCNLRERERESLVQFQCPIGCHWCWKVRHSKKKKETFQSDLNIVDSRAVATQPQQQQQHPLSCPSVG